MVILFPESVNVSDPRVFPFVLFTAETRAPTAKGKVSEISPFGRLIFEPAGSHAGSISTSSFGCREVSTRAFTIYGIQSGRVPTKSITSRGVIYPFRSASIRSRTRGAGTYFHEVISSRVCFGNSLQEILYGFSGISSISDTGGISCFLTFFGTGSRSISRRTHVIILSFIPFCHRTYVTAGEIFVPPSVVYVRPTSPVVARLEPTHAYTERLSVISTRTFVFAVI